MAQKYLDINGLTRYHEGLLNYMSEAVGTQADMSVTDPTNMAYIKNVPDWVRSETKPEYNAEEVGADATGTAHTEVSNHNVSETAHEDIRNLIQEINTQKETSAWDDKYTQKEVDEKDVATLTSAKAYTDTSSASTLNSAKEYNDVAYANANAYTDQKIADLINGAPTTLDTLKEIADAMTTEQSAVDALESAIGTKANKADLAAVAMSGKYSDLSGLPTIPTNNNQLSNGAGYLTGITKAMVTGALGYTPPTTDTNTTYSAGTGLGLSGTTFSVSYGTSAGTACQGNDSRLSNARPASDVYAWAKASSKPSYAWSEITGKPGSFTPSSHTHDDRYYTESEVNNLLGNKQNNLGFTPIQQGGGAGQSSNKVYIGWSGTRLKCQIDSTDMGNFVFDGHLASASVNYANSAGSVAWGNVSGRPSSMPASDVYAWAKASSKPSYSWSEIGSKPSTYTPSGHNQAASTITAGTFGGQVVAPASTAYTTNHVRNGVFTTTDPGAGASSSYANGSVIYVYE